MFVLVDIEWVERPFIRSAPDIVVEVSSPSTRRLELVRKLRLYERFGVPCMLISDADRVEVHRLENERFWGPRSRPIGSPHDAPAGRWSISVDELLGLLEDE